MWQNRKERVNQTTKNEILLNKTKRDVVSQLHLSNHRITELLKGEGIQWSKKDFNESFAPT